MIETRTREAPHRFKRYGDRQRAQADGRAERCEAEEQISRARISATIEERRRIARDLHDSVQSELLCLAIELGLAEEERDIPRLLVAKLAAMRFRTEAALGSIHEIVHDVPSTVLATAGFVASIRAQAQRAPVPVSVVGTGPRSRYEAEAAAYFVCQEALQNVTKHAGQDARVTLRLGHRAGTLGVSIEDDGGGFAPCVREGVGLTNIRERIAAVGGTLRVSSTRGHGTIVAFALPWPPPDSDPATRAAGFGE